MRWVYPTALLFGSLVSLTAGHPLVMTEARAARPEARPQRPWESSSPVGDFDFAPGGAPTAQSVKAVGPSRPGPLNMLSGQREARVEKDGYQAHEEAVTLAAEAARPVRAEATRKVAQVRAAARPVEVDMVRVPAGAFYYGCDESVDTECYDDEKPGRTITLGEFEIDKTEVTVSAFEACVRAGACKRPGSGGPCNWAVSGREDHPINCVNWYQARAYCAWVGKRLPNEQEWEKAARGTDGRIYPWGNERASCARAVMDDGSGSGCGRGDFTWPVGSKPAGASPYGALDMAGNVWEWTSSWFASQQPARAAMRGGPWHRNPRYLRASNRGMGNPLLGYESSGFRCAR